MVFLIQNTQNRDAKAIHLKLDELIRAVKEARNGLVDLENESDEELDKLHQQFQQIREEQGDLNKGIQEKVEETVRESIQESADLSEGES